MSWGTFSVLALLSVVAPRSEGAVLLGWDPSPSTTVTGYKVYYGVASRAYINVIDAGNVTSNIVSGLIGNVTYFFTVTAYTQSGLESDYSNEINLVPSAGSNTPPVISIISDQVINKNLTTAPIPFQVQDAETAAAALVVQASASNTNLMPVSRITFGGSGANRTITLSPALNQSGIATITVTVSDSVAIATRAFQLTVTGSNGLPVIVMPGPVSVAKDTTNAISGISITDLDGGSGAFSVSLRSGFGRIQVLTTVAAGLTAAQIAFNGSGNVQITAPLAAINRTFARSNGVSYAASLNFVGSDTLTAVVNDNGNTGLGGAMSTTGAVAVAVIGSNFDVWKFQNFAYSDLSDPTKEATIWGDNADPDQDGQDNLLEFALGLDPEVKQPTQQGVATQVVDVNGSKYFSLSYNHRKNEPSIQYIPEVSSDEQTWSSGTGAIRQVSVTNVNTTFEVVVCQDLTPITPDNPRFFRLRVIKN